MPAGLNTKQEHMQTDKFFYYESIEAAVGESDIRTKYNALRQTLYLAIDRRLEGVKVKFAGQLPKIQYLIREYDIRKQSKDNSLAIAINGVRIRFAKLDTLTDAELEATFPHDLKAVCIFISLIYDGHEIPQSLKQLFPRETDKTFLERLKSGDGKNIDTLRCIIEDWTDEAISVVRADTGLTATVLYKDPDAEEGQAADWSYLKPLLIKGEQLNIVRPRIKDDGTIVPELVIFNPDYLINVTAVAGCFEEYGSLATLNIISRIKPNVVTKPILLGNFAGQLLDEAAYGKKLTYAESLKRFFRDNAIDLACCDGIDQSFHTEAMAQQKNINDIMHSGDIHQHNNETLTTDDLILEPSFFCETLGLQGRMDFIHLNQDTIIEQKSGKGAFSRDQSVVRQQQKHYVQLLLYRAVFHYACAKKPYKDMASYLLYSKYENGLLELGSAPRLLFDAIRVRNQIAWFELHAANAGMDVLKSIVPGRLFPEAKGNILWERYQRPQMEYLLRPIHMATDLERAYCFRFLRFLSAEHVLAKVGNRTKENSGFAAIWNSSTEEKLQAGNMYVKLWMKPLPKQADGTDTANDIEFGFSESVDTDIVNFREGDIVIFYPYQPGEKPDATQTILFRANIKQIHNDRILLTMRYPQHAAVFDYFNRRHCHWAIEHDCMEASFNALYKSMHSFLSADKSRRDLILGQRMPETDTSVTLNGNYATNGDEEFNHLVSGAMQAKDIYLIIGPPGTGKTSYGMLNVLKEQLTHEGSSVLLMAYTNRAVDEICSKLTEEGIDFIRLGSEFGCAPEYHSHLISKRAEQCPKLSDVKRMIAEARVVCGTTTAFNSKTEIFKLKKFELAIVDEASQILEPYIIGLLSARHGDGNAIEKFVLIGDEKQLPAVVQQDADESRVTEPELNDIGLTDCRLSLFERLLRLYGKDKPEYCHVLSKQGRMHPEIADFPNIAFYQSRLRAVPLKHQQEPTPSEGPGTGWIDDMLTTRRVAFIDCQPNRKLTEPDKMNTTEAEIIADIIVAQYRLSEAKATDGEGGTLGADVAKGIGVIVPYRNQISTVRNAIDRRIKELKLPAELHDITIDTVERYQGSQRDLIIYGFTVKRYYQLAFLTDNEYYDETEHAYIDRKLNVAMTRARKHLVLVGNAALLSDDETFGRLISYTKDKQCFYTAK